MAKHKRTKWQRLQDLTRVAELYRQGRYQHEIAEELGVTQQQVSYDLRLLQRRFLETADVAFKARRLEEVAKIDARERAAWDGWLRSCQPRKRTSVKKIESKKLGRTEPSSQSSHGVSEEQRDGNPRFLEILEGCVEQRCKIWGIFAPNVMRVEDLSDEELLAIAASGRPGDAAAPWLPAEAGPEDQQARIARVVSELDAGAASPEQPAGPPDDVGRFET